MNGTSILILFYAYIFLLGICIGSFLNVCIYRIPQGISVAKGRSFCPTCHNNLKGLDMVPIFSFLLLRRKCRYCGAKISWRYLGVELACGLLYLLAFAVYGLSFQLIWVLVLFSVLLTVALIDYDTGEIPDRMHLLIAAAGIGAIFTSGLPWWEHLVGLAALALPIWLISVLLNGFGLGDVKLCAACGLLLGYKLVLLGGIFAILAGGVFGGILLLTKKVKRGAQMPFGPFLAAGFVAAACVGTPIINWYFGLFV